MSPILGVHQFDVKTVRTELVHTIAMAKQDDWVRLTIRIPKDLHERVLKGSVLSSVNTEIIRAIENQFPPEPSDEELAEDIEYLLGSLETTNLPKIRGSLQEALRKYTARIKDRDNQLKAEFRAKHGNLLRPVKRKLDL